MAPVAKPGFVGPSPQPLSTNVLSSIWALYEISYKTPSFQLLEMSLLLMSKPVLLVSTHSPTL